MVTTGEEVHTSVNLQERVVRSKLFTGDKHENSKSLFLQI